MEESTANSESTCTGDGLCDDETVEGRGVSSVREDGGSFGEVWDTGDASVFLVELCGDDLLFGSANRGEDVWLSLIITVCANTWELSARSEMGCVNRRTKIDLLLEAIGLECFGDTCYEDVRKSKFMWEMEMKKEALT